ncbi:hypothetical protein [Actinomyces vulturis]|uniref:hypothetical protein n=1 Tax=Actinomyces vulturis TaxID=1857645 RepID=UPI00082A8111|nr:hypothetical protein [Actinomyces vulturis]
MNNTNVIFGQKPVEVKNRIDSYLRQLANDPFVSQDDFIDQQKKILPQTGIAHDIAGRIMLKNQSRNWSADDIEQNVAVILLRAIGRGKFDRQRLGQGASFCGALRQYAWASRTDAYPKTDKKNPVALDDLYIEIAEPVQDFDHLDLSDEDIKESMSQLARKRGIGRLLSTDKILSVHYGLPTFIKPDDPILCLRLYQKVEEDSQLVKTALKAFMCRIDGYPFDEAFIGIDEDLLAVFDSTTPYERQKLLAIPEIVLHLHYLATLSLRQRPNETLRRRHRRAVEIVLPSASSNLIDRICSTFWDAETESVSAHCTKLSKETIDQRRSDAAANATFFISTLQEALASPGQAIGSDVQSARAFLMQTWANLEANQ